MTSNANIEIGTIFACTWGYSMVLPFFAKVIAKNGKQSLTIVELKANRDYYDKVHNQGSFLSVPTDVEDGKPYRVKVREGYMGELCIRGTCDHNAYIWDGKPLMCDDLD